MISQGLFILVVYSYFTLHLLLCEVNQIQSAPVFSTTTEGNPYNNNNGSDDEVLDYLFGSDTTEAANPDDLRIDQKISDFGDGLPPPLSFLFPTPKEKKPNDTKAREIQDLFNAKQDPGDPLKILNGTIAGSLKRIGNRAKGKSKNTTLKLIRNEVIRNISEAPPVKNFTKSIIPIKTTPKPSNDDMALMAKKDDKAMAFTGIGKNVSADRPPVPNPIWDEIQANIGQNKPLGKNNMKKYENEGMGGAAFSESMFDEFDMNFGDNKFENPPIDGIDGDKGSKKKKKKEQSLFDQLGMGKKKKDVFEDLLANRTKENATLFDLIKSKNESGNGNMLNNLLVKNGSGNGDLKVFNINGTEAFDEVLKSADTKNDSIEAMVKPKTDNETAAEAKLQEQEKEKEMHTVTSIVDATSSGIQKESKEIPPTTKKPKVKRTTSITTKIPNRALSRSINADPNPKIRSKSRSHYSGPDIELDPSYDPTSSTTQEPVFTTREPSKTDDIFKSLESQLGSSTTRAPRTTTVVPKPPPTKATTTKMPKKIVQEESRFLHSKLESSTKSPNSLTVGDYSRSIKQELKKAPTIEQRAPAPPRAHSTNRGIEEDNEILNPLKVVEPGCPIIAERSNLDMSKLKGEWFIPLGSLNWLSFITMVAIGRQPSRADIRTSCPKTLISNATSSGNFDIGWINLRRNPNACDFSMNCSPHPSTSKSKLICSGQNPASKVILMVAATDLKSWILLIQCKPKGGGMSWIILSRKKDLNPDVKDVIFGVLDGYGFNVSKFQMDINYASCPSMGKP